MMPVETSDVPNPTGWCRNCEPHGYFVPRTVDGGQWCAWCRAKKQKYGVLPDPTVLAMRYKYGLPRERVDAAMLALAETAPSAATRIDQGKPVIGGPEIN